MLHTNMRRTVLFAAAAVLAVAVIAGCAKKPMWGDPETGLMLTYRLEKDAAMAYRLTNDFEQTVDIMGQSMKITADEMHSFTAVSKGTTDGNLTLGVTMDSTRMDITTPQGEIKPDLSAVPGKSFEMVLSPLGEEVELIGADAIEYEMPGEGKRTFEATFTAIFPDLPAGAVTVGDSWTATDSILEASASGEMLLVLTNTHTLAGFETIRGMECAKITTTFTGTLHGRGTQGGMELVSDAQIEGTDTWYFAYEKGLFVQSRSSGSAKGAITDAGGQGFNIPLTREFTITNEIVKMQ